MNDKMIDGENIEKSEYKFGYFWEVIFEEENSKIVLLIKEYSYGTNDRFFALCRKNKNITF